MRFSETNALITGASRGLGAALAEQLAAAGARVALVARESMELHAVTQRILERGGFAQAFAVDVSDKQAVYPLAASVAQLVGPVNLLIHNASSLGPTPLRPLLDTQCEDLEQVLNVNLIGPFRLTRALAGAMALRGKGTIVHISSDAAVNAYPEWGAYAISKAALDHQARIWAAELGPAGVRSLAFDPGEMDTRMHKDALPDADTTSLQKPDRVAARLLNALQSNTLENGARFA